MTDSHAYCLICRRGDPRVCVACRARLRTQLAGLPAALGALEHALVPAPSGGEKVSASREAPLPLRLAALTLTAGGSDDARCVFVPKVRVWTEDRPYPVELLDDEGHVVKDDEGDPVFTEKVLTVWFREPVLDRTGRPVMTLADDQTGVLPVAAWARAWALDWRRAFGHAVGLAEPTARRPGEPTPPVPVADAARVLLGLGAALLPKDRPVDPLADEWALRWGRPAHTRGRLTDLDFRYLDTWLDHACDNHPHIADFAASLRSLVGTVRAALGDFDDLQYVGLCPEQITDRDGATSSICGAAIWQDPYVDKVVCPRCHTETDARHMLWLARRILATWPIDRRRRYHRGLIEALELPTCVTCNATLNVEWIDATERADSERFWRPGRVSCPAGCDDQEET